MSKNIAAIICAAGSSSRFSGKNKKPFVDVCGRAAFLRSIELFNEREDCKQVLLAISPEDQEIVNIKWAPNLQFFGVKIYSGGKERYDTVKKGLDLIKPDIDLIAVHDAARCCITAEMIDKVIARAAQTKAAILAAQLIPTLKQVNDNLIVKTIDREHLYQAQTPQVFDADLLNRAYENLNNLKNIRISDDAQLVELLGEPVSIVESDPSNIKITYPCDIAIAEAIIKSRAQNNPVIPLNPYTEGQW